jgi:hypothetical protein
MLIIFCDSVIDRKAVEPMYEAEWQAAKTAGHSTALISHEALVDEDNPRKATALVKAKAEKTPALYRGWMMRPEAYQLIYKALLNKNIELINDPSQYRHGHHFPESYPLIEAFTPKSRCLSNEATFDPEQLYQAVWQFGDAPLIIKDYVKSLKHYWEEACFIPSAADRLKAKGVIQKFLELVGDEINEGLVIREFVPLKQLTQHSKSGMPLAVEYRAFFYQGKLMSVYPYWEEGEYDEEIQVPEPFLEVAKTIQSNFFTMDIAQKEDGEWIIIELGDAQVAGLPDRAEPEVFYDLLK